MGKLCLCMQPLLFSQWRASPLRILKHELFLKNIYITQFYIGTHISWFMWLNALHFCTWIWDDSFNFNWIGDSCDTSDQTIATLFYISNCVGLHVIMLLIHLNDWILNLLFILFIHLKCISDNVKAMQALHSKVQTGMFAVCDSQAHISARYNHTLCKRKIWGWKFQSKAIISLPHNYIYHLILNGTLCLGFVLCGMQRSAPSI